MPGQIRVPLKTGSDADATHRPVGTGYELVDPPTLYLEKLGQQWMQARGDAKAGVSYILEALPAGYALYQKRRVSKPSHVDKWLYGHPDHKPFDSPNRFFPHFQHLMENDGSSIGCPCTVCNTNGGVLPPQSSRGSSKRSSKDSISGSSSITSTPHKRKLELVSAPVSAPLPTPFVPLQGRPKKMLAGMDTARVDEEGTPDIFRNLIDKLKRYGTLDETIMEPLSMDWRAEQSMLPEMLRTLDEEPQWIPRVGDIVLYISEIPDGLELLQHEETGEHMYWDPESGTFKGEPTWQAGLVGQASADKLTTEDAVYDSQAKEKRTLNNVSISGVRVEPLPSPNNTNKWLSKRYKYVPVHQTRPFVLWKNYLAHLSGEQWHPTIKNALTVMATVSLIGKHRFRGTWPDAQIHCHGIYIGSEMFAVGDTIRLLPKDGQPTSTDILKIKSIRLRLSNLDKASANDYDEGRPYNSEVWIFGLAYTMDSSRTNKEWFSASNDETPKSATGYAKWYPLHPTNKELAVPFTRVLGRLFEYETMDRWLPTADAQDIDYGREGLHEARDYARAHDHRIAESLDATWFWADSRSEALDVHTINGLKVSKFDLERDPSELRKKIKIMEGVAQTKTREGVHDAIGGAKRLRAFMAPGTGNATLPVRTTSSALGSLPGSASTGGRSEVHHREEKGVGEEDGHDNEEIRRQMRVVENVPGQKRAKVMVVID